MYIYIYNDNESKKMTDFLLPIWDFHFVSMFEVSIIMSYFRFYLMPLRFRTYIPPRFV